MDNTARQLHGMEPSFDGENLTRMSKSRPPELTAIEAYPSACKRSGLIQSLRQRVENQPRQDKDEMDALTCALMAYLFANRPEELIPPTGPTPASEGWIWIPKDIR